MFTRRRVPVNGKTIGFGIRRPNNFVNMHPRKPYPPPAPNPLDLRGARRANIQQQNENKAPTTSASPGHAAGETLVFPRKKFRPMDKATLKRNALKRSLKQCLVPPEQRLQKPTTGLSADPKFPGALSLSATAPSPSPSSASAASGGETAKELVDKLRKMRLSKADAHALKIFDVLKFRGQTRERYHENEAALDTAKELQPMREKYRALDIAHAAKHERILEENKREAEERRREEEARKREAEEIRRISEAHRRQVEDRLYMEERRRWFEETSRKQEEKARQARIAEEKRRKEAEERRIEEEQHRYIEKLRYEEKLRRLRLEREQAEAARCALEAQRRNDLNNLRQATRAAHEKIAYMEREHRDADAKARAAEHRVYLMQQELLARERQQWAQVQFFQQAMAEALREQARLEQTLREEHARAAAEAQQRVLSEQHQHAIFGAQQQRAEQAQREQQERAAREAQQRAQQAAREAAEQAAREAAERSAHEHAQLEARRAKEFCDLYDEKWAILKKGKSLVDYVSYAEFPIPAYPIMPNLAGPFPPSPEPSTITYEQVSNFVFSTYRAGLENKSRRDRVRAEMLRWHPDKFEGQIMRMIRPEDKEMMREAVGVVARILNNIKEQVDQED